MNVVYNMGEWETQYHNSMLQQSLGPAPLNPMSPVYLGIDDLQLLSLLEGEVLTGPLLVVKESNKYGSLCWGGQNSVMYTCSKMADPIFGWVEMTLAHHH